MLRIALIGPDGAGKTTIARELPDRLPVPSTYLYMGINADASLRKLPTTRMAHGIRRLLGKRAEQGGPRSRERSSEPPRHGLGRVVRTIKSLTVLANRIAEQVYRQRLARRYLREGSLVLFDRDYFCDYYAYDVAPSKRDRTLAQRLHGWVLEHVYPKPDLVIYLDAPPEVLFARKGEGTLELLAERRDDYRALREVVPSFVEVDASQPLPDVIDAVVAAIVDACPLLPRAPIPSCPPTTHFTPS